MEKLTNAVIVKITKHSNFIVGYKEGEVVVIPVDSELKEYGEAYIFNKRNESQTKATLGYCMVSNPEISFQFIPMTYQPGIVKGASYSVSIIQSTAEVSEFKNFFKKGL